MGQRIRYHSIQLWYTVYQSRSRLRQAKLRLRQVYLAMFEFQRYHDERGATDEIDGFFIPAEHQNGRCLVPSAALQPNGETMQLGAFSISLAVKDIAASRDFYEKFGFTVFGGDASKNWLILKNGDHVIGLFQGMFEKNTLTFNPGWDSNASPVGDFTDVRELQRQLKEQGVQLLVEADETTKGPAFFMVIDPDGNPVLVDQHV